jgi:N-acetylneuraminate synthase|tara:strand:+ start:712 stop:1731 length:1020 start_codon:yes stop_codon:yes gene_type:complete
MCVKIIAEAGVNHNGDINLAKELINIASDANADYIKFQSFKAESLATKEAEKSDYQKSNTKNDDTQYNMLKSLELSKKDHIELINYCHYKDIKFLSSAFDLDSLDFLLDLECELIKIPSGEINNYYYLEKISRQEIPVILSTGMSTINEIESAIKILTSNKLSINDITILHCNTEYPTPMIDVNLKAMLKIKEHFNVDIGYSDHTLGIEVPIAAVALGARVIEKHFTIDRSLEGPDHACSLEPLELKNMIDAIRNIEIACSGDGNKYPTASEIKNKLIVRKSLYSSKDIKKGTKLTKDMIIALRPGDGISPMEIPNLVGKTFKRNLKVSEKITYEDFEE